MPDSYGYAGKILRVDLSSARVAATPTMEYADRFIGGVGVAAKIYWQEVQPETTAFDPENRLIFMSGPLAGFPGLSGSRWVICGKCPTTEPEQFATSNLGGRWGAFLKFAGYDGVVVQGRSDNPVYLLITETSVEIKDAAHLWGKGALEARDTLKLQLGDNAAVATCGIAGENRVLFSSVIADNDAAAGNGFGAVMGAKNLKAIAVVRGSNKVLAANRKRLAELTEYVAQLREGFMPPAADPVSRIDAIRKDPCFGCRGQCHRLLRRVQDGTTHKSFCGAPMVYHYLARKYYGTKLTEMPAADIPMQAVILNDEYGLDVFSLVNYLQWLDAGRRAGAFTDGNTGLPLSKYGSWEFIQALLQQLAYREGFGAVVSQGIWKAGDFFGGRAKELLGEMTTAVERDGRVCPSCPRAFPAHAILVATQPTMHRAQQHEFAWAHNRWMHTIDDTFCGDGNPPGKLEGYYVTTSVFRGIAKRFWGSELAADFSTYEGKALAANKIMDRTYVKDSLGLCDFHWPIVMVSSGDHVGDPSLESKIYSAVTGNEVDEDGLNLIGERISNVRRAITVQERGGRESDTLSEFFFTVGLPSTQYDPACRMPGRDGEIISMKGAVVDRQGFEQMKDEYYELRGWDVAGVPTKQKLEALGLGDVAASLPRAR